MPGRLDTLTGGYGYDRRIVSGLAARGWNVAIRELDASFPFPTAQARAGAQRALAAIADGAIVLADGLAFGALPEEAEREAGRLRLVALVHHPLAAETGLSAEAAGALEASERRALATARRVVVTSRGTAASLAPYGVEPARLDVVEPGTDPAPLATGSLGGPLRLLCVASLVPRKGHDVLFRALAAQPSRNWRLTCVGSVDRHAGMAASLRELAAELGLADRVEFAGEADASTLPARYDAADLFVLPTLHEGYGMAVAEALARGIPVISTDTGAIAELAGDRAGVIVPPGDEKAFAEALAIVLDEGEEGAAARRRLVAGARDVRGALPTWEDAVSRLEEALSRVTG